AGRLGQQTRQLDGLWMQLHPPGSNALQIEQLVDELEQLAAVARHRFEKVALLRREWSAEILREQEIGEANNAVERGAQLVREVREKLVFRLHRRIEIGVQLLEALCGGSDFDREPSRVVMGRPAFARNRKVRCGLVERGAFVVAKLRARYDTQHPDQLCPRPQRSQDDALGHRRGETQL